MNTKYVCRGLFDLYEKFHNNRTMWSTNLHLKICRWGGEGKRVEVQMHINVNVSESINAN